MEHTLCFVIFYFKRHENKPGAAVDYETGLIFQHFHALLFSNNLLGESTYFTKALKQGLIPLKEIQIKNKI